MLFTLNDNINLIFNKKNIKYKEFKKLKLNWLIIIKIKIHILKIIKLIEIKSWFNNIL